LALTLPRVIGHRGVPHAAPENTLAGFACAAAMGVRWVELDVQLSRDLRPVVFHDDRLERTSNGVGRLLEKDFDALCRLDVGAWFSPEFAGEKLPSWCAVLDLLIDLGLGVNIEIKASDDRAEITAEKALAEALSRWPNDRSPPLVTSFSRLAVAAAHRLAPHWPRGWVTDSWDADWREVCGTLACDSLHVQVTELSETRVAAAKRSGLAVLGYVVDDPEVAHQLWGWGVDSVFSDRPERLLA
jgi:glycerophosphoryl diester phosphodiesterase